MRSGSLWGRARTARRGRGAPAPAGGPAPSDAGFALAELLVAGTATLLLALPAYAMLRRTLDVADLLATRFAQNAQARQIAALMADGTMSLVNNIPTVVVSGLHNRKAGRQPTGSSLRNYSNQSSLYQFVLTDGASGQVTKGDAVASRSVTCMGAGAPFPDCVGTETKGTVAGWLSKDPADAALSGPGGSVASYTFSLTSPYRAARAKTAAAVVTEQYRMQFNLDVEQ